jgi:hypothetical protein
LPASYKVLCEKAVPDEFTPLEQQILHSCETEKDSEAGSPPTMKDTAALFCEDTKVVGDQ